MTIDADGHGEIAFGALQAGLDIEYSTSVVFFTWDGFDEMAEVRSSGSANLQDDGSARSSSPTIGETRPSSRPLGCEFFSNLLSEPFTARASSAKRQPWCRQVWAPKEILRSCRA